MEKRKSVWCVFEPQEEEQREKKREREKETFYYGGGELQCISFISFFFLFVCFVDALLCWKMGGKNVCNILGESKVKLDAKITSLPFMHTPTAKQTKKKTHFSYCWLRGFFSSPHFVLYCRYVLRYFIACCLRFSIFKKKTKKKTISVSEKGLKKCILWCLCGFFCL